MLAHYARGKCCHSLFSCVTDSSLPKWHLAWKFTWSRGEPLNSFMWKDCSHRRLINVYVDQTMAVWRRVSNFISGDTDVCNVTSKVVLYICQLMKDRKDAKNGDDYVKKIVFGKFALSKVVILLPPPPWLCRFHGVRNFEAFSRILYAMIQRNLLCSSSGLMCTSGIDLSTGNFFPIKIHQI